jgi:hypothetical protein
LGQICGAGLTTIHANMMALTTNKGLYRKEIKSSKKITAPFQSYFL